MTPGRLAALVGMAVGVMAANVIMTFSYMVVYSHVISPGRSKVDYQGHVSVAAPYCSIAAGIPLMFSVGLWLGYWDTSLAVQSAIIMWATYAVIDVAVIAVSGATLRMGVLVTVSLITKLAAAYGGVLAALGRQG